MSASPLVIAGAAAWLFAERLRGIQVLGLALGPAGVGVAVSGEIHGAGGVGGVVALLVGMGGFVAGTLYQKRFGAAMDLRTGTLVQLLGALVTTLPLALATGGLAIPFTPAAVGSTLWLALVNSIGGFTLLFVLLRVRPGGSATSYLFLVPPFTALVAVPLLGQAVGVTAFAGIALAAVGVALVTRRSGAGRARGVPATDGAAQESPGEVRASGARRPAAPRR